MNVDDISNIASESGVIASLIHNPDYIYYSEKLLPTHFTDHNNMYMYAAIMILTQKGIRDMSAYNIMSALESTDGTRKASESFNIEDLKEFIENSDIIARRTPEEYKLIVDNVLDMAMRRDIYRRLRDCEAMCFDAKQDMIEQSIYQVLDDVMNDYSSTNDAPEYSEIVDDCWEEIKRRQGTGYAGIPFAFKTLNDYVTIERGELIVFAGSAKGGKSMMLLNCAVSLLEAGHSVLYIDSELSTRLFTSRLLSRLTGIEFKRITSGNYSDEEANRIGDAIAWMKSRKFIHKYIPLFDQATIYTTAKRAKHTMDIDVIIIDYFKGSSSGDAYDSYAELGRFVDMVKNQICGDMNVCGIGAAQLNGYGKIADSAKISRNASTIITITDKTLEEMQADGPECGNKKLRVVLNRNGPQMIEDEYIDMNFDGNRATFQQAKQHIPQSPY